MRHSGHLLGTTALWWSRLARTCGSSCLTTHTRDSFEGSDAVQAGGKHGQEKAWAALWCLRFCQLTLDISAFRTCFHLCEVIFALLFSLTPLCLFYKLKVKTLDHSQEWRQKCLKEDEWLIIHFPLCHITVVHSHFMFIEIDFLLTLFCDSLTLPSRLTDSELTAGIVLLKQVKVNGTLFSASVDRTQNPQVFYLETRIHNY